MGKGLTRETVLATKLQAFCYFDYDYRQQCIREVYADGSAVMLFY